MSDSKMNNASVIDRGKTPLATIFLLAWPTIIEQLMMTAVSYADTIMVGSLGAYATAAVSINQSPTMLVNGLLLSIGVGFTALVARNVGAKDIEKAKKVIRQAMIMVILGGIAATALLIALTPYVPKWMGAEDDVLPYAIDYLYVISAAMLFRSSIAIMGGVIRGAGDTKSPMYINIAVNVVNVVGNYLLIYEPHNISILGLDIHMHTAGMGVIGAAIATSASTVVGGLAMFLLLMFKKGPLKIHAKESFKPDREILSEVFGIAIPAASERLAMSGAQVLQTSLVAGFGTITMAAHHITVTAESLSFMPGFGFATAATTLVGQSAGAKKIDLAEKFAYLTTACSAVVMAIGGVLLFIFARPIVSLFTIDPAVEDIAFVALRIMAFVQPFFAVSMTISGAMRGVGDTKTPFYVLLASMWTIRIGAAYIMVHVFHADYMATCICMAIEIVFRATLYMIMFRRGGWKKYAEKKAMKAKA